MDTVIFGTGPFTEGAVYTGSNGIEYVYKNGCFVIPSPVDVDTVDGYSEQAISDGTQLDANGAAIPAGAPIINFYDAEGNLVNSKDCTELNDYGVLITAPAAGTDTAGNAYAAGDPLIELPNGELICVKKTIDTDTDTFAGLIFAAAPGTDDLGNAYVPGDPLLQLANGDLVSLKKTVDTNTDTVDGYSIQTISDGTALDLDGNAIPAGAPIITFYDANGAVINSKDCTELNDYGVLITATADGVDTAGNAYAAGDPLIELPDGELICVSKTIDTDTFAGLIFATGPGVDSLGNAYVPGDPLLQLANGDLVSLKKTVDTNTDTVDGYSLQAVSDGTQLDADGNAIEAGAPIITFYDSTGAVINSKDCTDSDTLVEDSDGLLLPLNPNTNNQVLPAPPVGSSTAVSADGTAHEITTADDVTTSVCVTQFKGLRDNEDGSYTETFLNQDGTTSEGQTFQLIPDTDQRLTNPVITQETVDGVTTHTVTWDIVDIDGNVIGEESAEGISLPVFTDKAGAALTGPITPLRAEEFEDGEFTVDDSLLAFGPNGECKKVPSTCCITQEFCARDLPSIFRVYDTATEQEVYYNADGTLFEGDTAAYVLCSEFVPCEPICWIVADDLGTNGAPTQLDDFSMEYPVDGAPYANVSIETISTGQPDSSFVGILAEPPANSPAAYSDFDSFAVGPGPVTNQPATPTGSTIKARMTIELLEPICGPFGFYFIDWDQDIRLRDNVLDNIVPYPDRIAMVPSGNLASDPEMRNGLQLSAPLTTENAEAVNQTIGFFYEDAGCRTKFQFDLEVTKTIFGSSGIERFVFAFAVFSERQGCVIRPPSGDNIFEDSEGNVIERPNNWQFGNECKCIC